MDSSIPFYLSYGALWVLIIVQSLILLGLVRVVYQLQNAQANAPVSEGKPAPQFNAIALSGASIDSASFAGRLTALLFVSTTCPACTTSLTEMNALKHKTNGNVIVICRAGAAECARLAETYKLTVPVVTDESEMISRLYNITTVPTAVLINANNRIQSHGYPLREKLEEAFEQAPIGPLQEVA